MTDARILMGNQYLEARNEAAKYNPSLSTQAGAAEVLDVDTATLGRWERGETVPSNHKVRLMAQVYNAPLLMHNYCAYACPIGFGRVKPLDDRPIERTAISLHKYARQMDELLDGLLDILANGRVDPDEIEDFYGIIGKFQAVGRRINALSIYAEQKKGERDNGGREQHQDADQIKPDPIRGDQEAVRGKWRKPKLDHVLPDDPGPGRL